MSCTKWVSICTSNTARCKVQHYWCTSSLWMQDEWIHLIQIPANNRTDGGRFCSLQQAWLAVRRLQVQHGKLTRPSRNAAFASWLRSNSSRGWRPSGVNAEQERSDEKLLLMGEEPRFRSDLNVSVSFIQFSSCFYADRLEMLEAIECRLLHFTLIWIFHCLCLLFCKLNVSKLLLSILWLGQKPVSTVCVVMKMFQK